MRTCTSQIWRVSDAIIDTHPIPYKSFSITWSCSTCRIFTLKPCTFSNFSLRMCLKQASSPEGFMGEKHKKFSFDEMSQGTIHESKLVPAYYLLTWTPPLPFAETTLCSDQPDAINQYHTILNCLSETCQLHGTQSECNRLLPHNNTKEFTRIELKNCYMTG